MDFGTGIGQNQAVWQEASQTRTSGEIEDEIRGVGNKRRRMLKIARNPEVGVSTVQRVLAA